MNDNNCQEEQLILDADLNLNAAASGSSSNLSQFLNANEGEEEEEQEQIVTSTTTIIEGAAAVELSNTQQYLSSPAQISSSTNFTENDFNCNRNNNVAAIDLLSGEEEDEIVAGNAKTANEIEVAIIEPTAASSNCQQQPINGRIDFKSHCFKEMVARDALPATVADTGGGVVAVATATADADKEKIILKFSKHVAQTNNASAQQQLESQQHVLDADADAASSSCSNSSSSGFAISEDTRKVEPLKIHLQQNVVPKITIRPIVKQQQQQQLDAAVISDGSSSAEDEMLLLQHDSKPLTEHCNSNAAAHVVPKLTIRAASDDNATHSSIVPKLTIKMSEATTQAAEHLSNSVAPPPLPKLTIKTTQHGHSESMLSSISPASLSSSSSSSSVGGTDVSNSVVPKLTIKTNASGSCISSKEAVPTGSSSNEVVAATAVGDECSKIPKLTIKTNQEHAVIVKAHKDTTTTMPTAIPKLTIKTKSMDYDENVIMELAPEKIPKITIKTQETPTETHAAKFCIKTSTQNDSSTSPVIPKLTISVANMECSTSPQSPKTAALKVRQMASNAMRKTESPERVPKLMIKRRDSMPVSVTTANHCNDMAINRLTIKTNHHEAAATGNKIPKLTIKTKKSHKTQQQQHQQQQLLSSDESADDADEQCLSNDDDDDEAHAAAKTVPKLTIKNLSSPKLKMKAVLERKVMRSNSTDCSSRKLAHKQPIAELAIETSKVATPPPLVAPPPTVQINGELSNSQEFCGFSNLSTLMLHEQQTMRRNSDDMDIDEVLQQHDPQVFNNMIDFDEQNGAAFAMSLDLPNNKPTVAQQEQQLAHEHMPEQNADNAEIIDTVDLTTSPSPGSTPVHFKYTDADPQLTLEEQRELEQTMQAALQEQVVRERSVIQQMQMPALLNTTNFLLRQLTSPQNAATLPPMNMNKLPSPSSNHQLTLNTLNNHNNCVKYPQLTERLMANGAHSMAPTQLNANNNSNALMHEKLKASNIGAVEENVIDSIEILDSPEGSPCPASAAVDAEEAIDHNIMMQQQKESQNHLKRHVVEQLTLDNSLDLTPNKMRRIENDAHTMATLTILTNDHSPKAAFITTSPTIIQTNHKVDATTDLTTPTTATTVLETHTKPQHRSRKQKHEHLLPALEDDTEQMKKNAVAAAAANQLSTPTPKKRGRPKKQKNVDAETDKNTTASAPVAEEDTNKTAKAHKARLSRVQLLRKRLAIDMVAADEPLKAIDELESVVEETASSIDVEANNVRPMRTPVRAARMRSATPIVAEAVTPAVKKTNAETPLSTKRRRRNAAAVSTEDSNTNNSTATTTTPGNYNNFSGSNSSLCSNSCSNSALSASMITTMANCLAGNNYTDSATNSMLPPSTILSCPDPVPDVIFRPNEYVALMSGAANESQDAISALHKMMQTNMLLTPAQMQRAASQTDSQDEDANGTCGSGADNSEEDSASSLSQTSSGRGRGRGRGRGSRSAHGGSVLGSGRGSGRGRRLGRGASAVAKAIAKNRPRCVGGLKHTPDPERLKNLFLPSPQVFEEDTRMSADLNQSLQSVQSQNEIQTAARQLDFSGNNNEESQSSIISSKSILDMHNLSMQSNAGSMLSLSTKKPNKRKMEIVLSEDADFTVASIAEYDWPPPKGCCPSKNRDTFMIQEQVALYLGIKSFKRKYPDLPRRSIDMEERNWLQEKGFVSEKMCDLGITAVWASDILDIMYTDFYEKYEEYKEFVRQKHLREIEFKQKALGLNIGGKHLQARDRAMLSASKWNAYFNRTRKDERAYCLDLQTFVMNKPLPAVAPASTLVNRSIAEAVVAAAKATDVAEPPTLLKARNTEPPAHIDLAYPLAFVPGQFCGQYKEYTPMELSCYPLNTQLNDPKVLWQQHLFAATVNLCESDDTESNVECTQTSTSATNRLPKRRSRRERLHAASNRVKDKCDTLSEDDELPLGKIQQSRRISQTNNSANSATATATSAGSSSSSSETQSDSDSSNSDSSSSSNSNTGSSSSTSCSSDNEEAQKSKTCSVCHRTQHRNLKDLPELFIKCYTCRRKVHPSCIELPHRMVARVRNYNWQCAECKCCMKCKRKQEQNKMLFCEQCDRGYHIYCLGIKAAPDYRWSCERCSICMRCGATKPEGLPIAAQNTISPTGEKIKPVKHKKVKWINEYRIDHITKLREHCSMLCVPCGRMRTSRRVQISSVNNINNNNNNNNNNNSNNNNNNNTNNNSIITAAQQAKMMSPPVCKTAIKAATTATAAAKSAAAAAAAATVATANETNANAGNSTQNAAAPTVPPPAVVA